MKQRINIDIKGHLLIKNINNGKILFDNPNALLPNYRNIIRRCISGQSDNQIDQIEVWYQGNLLTTVNVYDRQYSTLTNNEVTFFAKFLDTDFDSDFDKVVLRSNQGGEFSEVINLSLSKDNNTTLLIQWTLKIINNF